MRNQRRTASITNAPTKGSFTNFRTMRAAPIELDPTYK
jgi:hypothetical protein